MKIVFLDRDTIGPQVELTRPAVRHDWAEWGRTAPGDVVERLAGATVAITNKVPIDAAAIAALPELKLIAVAATGTNMLALDAARSRGIVVSNVPAYATTTVPEHTFALLLALRRSIVGYRQDVLAGEWQRAGQFCFFTHPIRDLRGSRLGVIGGGTLGQAVAALGRAFGMDVVFAGRKGEAAARDGYLPFADVLRTADVLTLHLPLTPDTRGLIGREEFAQMAQRPLLINTARGGLVDEAALVEALDAGQIAGAGFDVLSEEPPRGPNPLLAIAGRPNVIVTPHVAWASREAMAGLWATVVRNIEDFARGAPGNIVR